MPKFNYVAMDSRGKETKGSLDVANQNEAISRLKEMGYFPTKVAEAAGDKAKGGKKKSAKKKKKGKKQRKKGKDAESSDGEDDDTESLMSLQSAAESAKDELISKQADELKELTV